MGDYRHVPGFPRVEVAEDGRTRLRVGRAWKHLLASRPPKGIMAVSLAGRGYSVAWLVARAFLGDPPIGPAAVRHLDGSRANCRANNLAWTTTWAIHHVTTAEQAPYRDKG